VFVLGLVLACTLHSSAADTQAAAVQPCWDQALSAVSGLVEGGVWTVGVTSTSSGVSWAKDATVEIARPGSQAWIPTQLQGHKPCGPKSNHVDVVMSSSGSPVLRAVEDRTSFLRRLTLSDGCTLQPHATLSTLARGQAEEHSAVFSEKLVKSLTVMGTKEHLVMRLTIAGDQSSALSTDELHLGGAGVTGFLWWRRDVDDGVEIDAFVTGENSTLSISHVVRARLHSVVPRLVVNPLVFLNFEPARRV
jgi:hypothetical protein